LFALETPLIHLSKRRILHRRVQGYAEDGARDAHQFLIRAKYSSGLRATAWVGRPISLLSPTSRFGGHEARSETTRATGRASNAIINRPEKSTLCLERHGRTSLGRYQSEEAASGDQHGMVRHTHANLHDKDNWGQG
jgi:hypothetical protein